MKIFLKNIKVKINFLNIKNKLKNENLLIINSNYFLIIKFNNIITINLYNIKEKNS